MIRFAIPSQFNCGAADLAFSSPKIVVWGFRSPRFPKTRSIYQNLYIVKCMPTKTISLRPETYEALKRMKQEGESYSDVIDRLLLGDRINLADYFGAIKDEDLLRGLTEDSEKIRGSSVHRPRL